MIFFVISLNKRVSTIQAFYFVAKFGLVLIYILKVYRKKSSSIFLRKNIFNSLFAFCFWKACTYSSFELSLFWKSRNYSQMYLSGIINYWGSILTLYITLSFVCVLSVFFLSFFLVVFFIFYRYFSWQTLTLYKMGGERQ